MTIKEIEEARLAKVIEMTLEEYVTECEMMGHHVDKCGYVGQIQAKVEAK